MPIHRVQSKNNLSSPAVALCFLCWLLSGEDLEISECSLPLVDTAGSSLKLDPLLNIHEGSGIETSHS